MWLRAEAVKQIINHSAIQCPTSNLQPRCVARVFGAHYKCIFHVYPLFVSYIYIFWAIYADPGKFQQCQQLAILRTEPPHHLTTLPPIIIIKILSFTFSNLLSVCLHSQRCRRWKPIQAHIMLHQPPVPAPDTPPQIPEFRWCRSPLSVVRFRV